MRDIMIDIETLGTRPGSVTVSIGAVEFNAETGTIGRQFYTRVSPKDGFKQGLTIDVDTVLWWMQQDENARQTTFFGEQDTLWFALHRLGEWVKVNSTPDLRVWGNGPSFDLVQLEEAYRSVNQDAPWSFRAHRDLRTLRDITGVDIPQVGTTHNALDDAMAQAMAVIKAYEVLGLSRQPVSEAA